MPKVNFHPRKGIYITAGSGFQVTGTQVAENFQTDAAGKVGHYSLVIPADVGNSLNNTWFIVYDENGTSWGIWFDVSSGGSDPTSGVDNALEIDISTDDANSVVCGKLVTQLRANATFNAAFQALQPVPPTMELYCRDVGPMAIASGSSVDAGITGWMPVDGNSSPVLNYGATNWTTHSNSQAAGLAITGSIPDGTQVGQRKLLTISAIAAGSTAFSGNFSVSTDHTLDLCSFEAPGAGVANYAYLVWTGTDWGVISSGGTTFITA